DVGTIGISGVYKIDAQFSGMAKNRERRSGVLGWPPDSVAGDTHGSETKTVNGQFTAQRDSSTGTCERTRCFFVHIRSSKVFVLLDVRGATIVPTGERCP